ncbi:MAG: hypothetical protein U9Q73_00290 [Nanoarchaeota archaeon]|nr:hypothetical protein [Nanoarchaeota archaeon]
MREKVWDFILKQLIEEYGPEPDLKKYSILNSEFVYHRKPEKLPPSLIEQIEKETKERLTKLRLSHS